MAIYMKYDAIKGTVSASGHEQWIELSSFKYDITRAISAPTGSKADRESSAPTVGEIVITKRTDRSTVGLLG
ncbi:MAG TPA: type VI secretion system tube protein Hcp, partial [Stellaceae bacterium]|nr:type VI secretion system tube protein Hcp [Stellaceae bacterium]